MTTAELEAAAKAYADKGQYLTAFQRRLTELYFIDGFLAGHKQALQEVQDEFKQGSKPCR